MKARKVVFTGHGDLDKIQIAEFNIMDPQENEVQIKVQYSGLAFADVMLRKIKMPGMPLPPFTPGADLSGVVEKTGAGVTEFQKGDRVAVLLMAAFGGQAEYINVPQEKLQKIPDDVPSEKAVCMLVNYLTAYQMLKPLNIFSTGETKTILVHGGSGGVGSALIQLTVSHGHKVITTVSKQNLDMVREMGALGIDYKTQDFVSEIKKSSQAVDIVLDSIGGNYLRRSIKVLKKGGTYVGYGFHANVMKGTAGFMQSIISFYLKKAFTWRKHLAFFQIKDNDPKSYNKDLRELFKLYNEGKIDPVISEIIPLENAKLAHSNLEKGKKRGKILLQPFST